MAGGHNDNGIARLERKLRGLTHIDFTPLMVAWEDALHVGNSEGIMAGLDGRGNPMVPVTYRPEDRIPKYGPTSRFHPAKGPLPYNNLRQSQYEKLTGPPLAPRGLNSRVITNYVTAHAHIRDRWMVTWAWENVLDVKGRPFLKYHFLGMGIVQRDLRGVRPVTVKVCRTALKDFMHWRMNQPE